MMKEDNYPWKSQHKGFEESLRYLKGRMDGNIKSFKTPWEKFNAATVDGLEWNSLTVIGGRPGSGKTLIKDQIVRSGFSLNPGQDFRVLEFQFEMLQKVSAIREYSSILGKSYNYLCSADKRQGKLKADELKRCYEYAQDRVKYPIDVIDNPCTVKTFTENIKMYMEVHQKPAVVTLDHSMLMKLDGNEDKLQMVYNLGESLTYLKRNYPIAFIILSQLNRNIDRPERNEDGRYGNYILESDIFGGDALLQHADTLVGLNRPAKQKIRFYGVDRYVIEDASVLVMHYLKCRNGDTGLGFFKAEFEKMRIVEMETPPTQDKRVNTK